MPDMERVIFTKEMKKEYTILVPTMLPVHFKLMLNIMRENGYGVEQWEDTGCPVSIMIPVIRRC